jgi:hypothetical protein
MAGMFHPSQCIRHGPRHRLGVERSESGGGRKDGEFGTLAGEDGVR